MAKRTAMCRRDAVGVPCMRSEVEQLKMQLVDR